MTAATDHDCVVHLTFAPASGRERVGPAYGQAFPAAPPPSAWRMRADAGVIQFAAVAVFHRQKPEINYRYATIGML